MPQHFHRLQTEELTVVIGDNVEHEEHKAGYNGIWELSSVHDEQPFYVLRLGQQYRPPWPES